MEKPYHNRATKCFHTHNLKLYEDQVLFDYNKTFENYIHTNAGITTTGCVNLLISFAKSNVGTFTPLHQINSTDNHRIGHSLHVETITAIMMLHHVG